MSRQQVFDELKRTMCAQFELDPDDVHEASTLYEDLDLDSIDAVDMAVKIQKMTGQKVEDEELRKLRTVGEMVTLVLRMQQATET